MMWPIRLTNDMELKTLIPNFSLGRAMSSTPTCGGTRQSELFEVDSRRCEPVWRQRDTCKDRLDPSWSTVISVEDDGERLFKITMGGVAW